MRYASITEIYMGVPNCRTQWQWSIERPALLGVLPLKVTLIQFSSLEDAQQVGAMRQYLGVKEINRYTPNAKRVAVLSAPMVGSVTPPNLAQPALEPAYPGRRDGLSLHMTGRTRE